MLRRLCEACREGVSLEREAVLGTKRGVARRALLSAACRALLLCKGTGPCSMRAAQIGNVRLPIGLPCLLRLPARRARGSERRASSTTRGVLGVLARGDIESSLHLFLVFESSCIRYAFLRVLRRLLQLLIACSLDRALARCRRLLLRLVAHVHVAVAHVWLRLMLLLLRSARPFLEDLVVHSVSLVLFSRWQGLPRRALLRAEAELVERASLRTQGSAVARLATRAEGGSDVAALARHLLLRRHRLPLPLGASLEGRASAPVSCLLVGRGCRRLGSIGWLAERRLPSLRVVAPERRVAI